MQRLTTSAWIMAAMLAIATALAAAQPLATTGGDAAQAPAADAILKLDDVPKSQAATVHQRVANTDITITYSRPVARGRVLFGGIVPYGEVWNPGADQATAITITRPIDVNGHHLAAGGYSLWLIPRTGPWTTTFSTAADVYHTPYPGETRDALRMDISPQRVPQTETLTFDFPIVEGKDAQLQFRWGTTAIVWRITVP